MGAASARASAAADVARRAFEEAVMLGLVDPTASVADGEETKEDTMDVTEPVPVMAAVTGARRVRSEICYVL